ncbi:MAG: hypothetical protein QXT77_00140 [Candidatus Methanomethylicaceae archaeon]
MTYGEFRFEIGEIMPFAVEGLRDLVQILEGQSQWRADVAAVLFNG